MHPGYELDWNLVRCFAAVAKAGSLAQAASLLGVSHATVTRHVGAFEQALGAPLFDRTSNGLTLNPNGEALAPAATAMHDQALRFAAVAERLINPTNSIIRVTASELLSPTLPQLLKPLAQRSDVTVELIPTDDALNLLERDADIAIRHGLPSQQDLVCRRIGELPLCLWASDSYVAEHGMPSVDDPTEHRFIVDADGRMVKSARELGYDIQEAQIAIRCSSRTAEIAAMQAGWGIGVLPAITAGLYSGLTQVLHDFPMPRLPVWLIARPELRQRPIGRELFDALADALAPSLSEAAALHLDEQLQAV